MSHLPDPENMSRLLSRELALKLPDEELLPLSVAAILIGRIPTSNKGFAPALALGLIAPDGSLHSLTVDGIAMAADERIRAAKLA